MKKTAVLIYDQFCNFEISVALEMLAMAGKPIVIFAKDKEPVRSEEGVRVLPDRPISEIDFSEFDSLLLPGAMDIRSAVEDDEILQWIQQFYERKAIIGAISIAPILLLKLGILKGKRFLAGANPEDLYEEGFTKEDLANMVGWDANIADPIPEGYLRVENMITSVSYNFVKWAMAFGEAVGIKAYPEDFGLEK